jgi:excisionase family DNA binding protein
LIERRRAQELGYELPLSTREAANYIGFHPKTVERMARKGEILAHPVSRSIEFSFFEAPAYREPPMIPDITTADQKAPSSRPMTPQAAAEYLGMDVKTVTRWARKAYIPAYALGEGKRKFWRFFESELLIWLSAQRNSAEAQ